MERHFDHQLDKLKTRLIKMSSLVDEQVEFAIRSIDEGNTELAKLVIERDRKVDKYDIKVDKICMKLFALNQPVAMDLRLIMSALTINNNLERIGDLAVDIAREAEILKEKPVFITELQYKETTDVTREMVRLSIDSFIDNDANLAKKVLESDKTLDNLVGINNAKLIEVMKRAPGNIDAAISLYRTLLALERLGDHSTNIAENVYFIVEAQMIKHRYEDLITKADSENDEEEKLSD